MIQVKNRGTARPHDSRRQGNTPYRALLRQKTGRVIVLVRIITDSAADFEPEELRALALPCVPLSVSFGSRTYQETVELSKQRFYELLEQEDEIPQTSQPAPEAFLSVLQEAKDAGEEAVVITLSSQLSGTFQCAQLAKELLDYEDCCIVDSRTATAGERILVEHALALRDKGMCAKEIASSLEALRPRMTLYACMDTLKYLHKGGRLSGSSYVIGSFANIKPILHVTEEGKAKIAAKAMGIRKGIRWLCEQIVTRKPAPGFLPYVMYTHDRTNGERLAEALRERGFAIPSHRIVNVGAVVGTHIGPNAFGLVYVAAQEAGT